MAMINAVVPHLLHLAARDNGTDLPGNKTPQEYATEGRYDYPPSFAAAIIFLILFGAVLLANIGLFFWHRAWFWWVMLFGVILEFVGYLGRAMSIKNLDSEGLFVIQLVLILIAPAVLAAACYMAFGRIVLWVVPARFQTARYLWVPARRITPVFVGADVFSFFVQVIGGSMTAGANTPSKLNTGKNVVLIGLALQLGAFGFFIIASFRFNMVLRKQLQNEALPKERNWQLFLTVINVASVLILIRTILRFIEFAAGTSNYLINHEWFFYCFDSVPMFLVTLTLVVFHPGHYLPYLGIRRRQLQFSRNADKGPFAKFSQGSTAMELS